MIKDVMVHLDGTAADETRLAAVDDIAELFQSRVIGLFLNVLPLHAPGEEDGIGAIRAVNLLQLAREAGDKTEIKLTHRLARLQKPVELRRFDGFVDAIADFAAREARTADAFVALRPNGAAPELEQLVERVLFGSGRHLVLLPPRKAAKATMLDHILLAWNGSRESARAMAEAMPYLRKARAVTVIVVDDEPPVERNAMEGVSAVDHLKQYEVNAVLHHARARRGDVGATLMNEAKQRKANLIVMGGYGHSRLREWFLGGTTYELLHEAHVPLLVAH
jgi:nucleotide-binding universal stress UspA family protein